MEYSEELLDKIRLEDIDLFAHKYANLFGEHFGHNTREEKGLFYEEIKEELLRKAPKYILEDRDPVREARGEAHDDKIILTKYSIGDLETRIHELFHAYNRMDSDRHGLRNFDDEVVLYDLDEGSTEMFTQIMCGNRYGEPDAYDTEVELVRFLTAICGEETMLKATRGNPQLITDKVDKLFGTDGLINNLSNLEKQWDKLVEDHYSKRSSNVKKLLSEIKIEELRGNGAVDTLFNFAESLEDKSIYNKLRDADSRYGYDVFFKRFNGIGHNKFDPSKPTLADMQQEILKQEIDELDNVDVDDFNLQVLLELEIKKFMYDKITFQKHFLDHKKPKYDKYEITEEDLEFADNFKSELDEKNSRLGGILGIVGPGYSISELENAPHLINEDVIKKIYIQDIGMDELKDYRMEMWAEKLNIEKEKELIDEWKEYIYNGYYKEELDYLDLDDNEYENAINGIKDKLEQKDKGLVEKYRELEKEKSKEEISKESQEPKEIEKEEAIMPDEMQETKLETVENQVQQSVKSNTLFLKSKTRTSRVNQTWQAIKELVKGKAKEKEEQDKE